MEGFILIDSSFKLDTNPYNNNALNTSSSAVKKTAPVPFKTLLSNEINSSEETMTDKNDIDPNILEINKETDPDERAADLKLYQNLKKSGVNFSIQSFQEVKQGLVTFPPVTASGKIRNAISNITDSEGTQGTNINGQLLFSFQDFIENNNPDLNSLNTYKKFGAYMSNSLDVLLKRGEISQSNYNVGKNITQQLQNIAL